MEVLPEIVKQFVWCILGFICLGVFVWFLLGLCMAAGWADEQMERMQRDGGEAK